MACKPQKEIHFNGKHPHTQGDYDLIFGCGKDGYLKVTADTTITTVDDGDEAVLELEGLYIASGVTLTVSNRCKGLIIKCRGDVTIEGVISMTGKGAFGTGTPYRINPTLPSGNYALQRLNSFLFQYFANEVSGTGAPGGTATTAASTAGTAGNWNFAGGGAGGRSNDNNKAGGKGGEGGAFGGGAGGGGAGGASRDGGSVAPTAGAANAGAGGNGGKAGNYGDAYHGAGGGGGGAGNPGGSKGGSAGYGTKSGGLDGTTGVGGLLMIMTAGSISIASTGIVEANGCLGGKGYSVSGISTVNGGSGGAGSGGGIVVLLYRAVLITNGSIVANGGAGGGAGSGSDYGSAKGGMAGGAGFTFAGQI